MILTVNAFTGGRTWQEYNRRCVLLEAFTSRSTLRYVNVGYIHRHWNRTRRYSAYYGSRVRVLCGGWTRLMGEVVAALAVFPNSTL